MPSQMKLEARARAAQILAVAVQLAEWFGYTKVTREQVAKRLDIAPSLVPHYMGSVAEMRRKIMREAIRVENLPVIAQGLAVRDSTACRALADRPELRQRAAAHLAR